MEYTVISNKKVCGKVKDEKLTKDDILEAGSNVEFLLEAGHIVSANAVKAVSPATPQEPKVSVFNSVNNEQGEK